MVGSLYIILLAFLVWCKPWDWPLGEYVHQEATSLLISNRPQHKEETTHSPYLLRTKLLSMSYHGNIAVKAIFFMSKLTGRNSQFFFSFSYINQILPLLFFILFIYVHKTMNWRRLLPKETEEIFFISLLINISSHPYYSLDGWDLFFYCSTLSQTKINQI